MRTENSSHRGEDKLLTGAVAALVLAGLVAIYDTSYARSGGSQLIKQCLWVAAGMVAYQIGKRLSPERLYRLAPFAVLLALLLVLAVLTPFGESRGGAVRWLLIANIGGFEVTFQPAEFTKVALILWLARLLSHPNLVTACDPILKGRLPRLAVVSIFLFAGIVVIIQNDLGTALLLLGIGLGMLFVAGLRWQHTLMLVALLLVLGVAFTLQKDYRRQRVVAFTQPFNYIHTSGYQLAHSLMGIGTGGVWGTGLGMGRAKEFLPAADTDFIFATIAEETGIWGATLVIGLLMVVTWRVFRVAFVVRNMFVILIVSGVGLMLALQSLLNLYVVTGSVPTTGVPLPFISYGGSSLVSLLFSIGLVQKTLTDFQSQRAKGAEYARASSGRRNRRTPVSSREYRRGVA